MSMVLTFCTSNIPPSPDASEEVTVMFLNNPVDPSVNCATPPAEAVCGMNSQSVKDSVLDDTAKAPLELDLKELPSTSSAEPENTLIALSNVYDLNSQLVKVAVAPLLRIIADCAGCALDSSFR